MPHPETPTDENYDAEAAMLRKPQKTLGFVRDQVFTQQHLIAIMLGFARDVGWAGATALEGLQFLLQTGAQCAVGGGAIALAAVAVYYFGKKLNPDLNLSDVIIPMIASWTAIPGWNVAATYGGQWISSWGEGKVGQALGNWNEGWLPGPVEAPWQQLMNWLSGSGEQKERDDHGVGSAMRQSIMEYFTQPGLLKRLALSIRDAGIFSPGGSVWMFVYLAVFNKSGGSSTQGLGYGGSALTGVAVGGAVATSSTVSQFFKAAIDNDKCSCTSQNAPEIVIEDDTTAIKKPVVSYGTPVLTNDGDDVREPASLSCCW